MISNKKYKQYCIGPMKAKGITIHNTNNDLSARKNYELMLNSASSHSAHFFVDSTEIIQAIPIDRSCCHTGKGNDNGNKFTIAIEVCSKGKEDEWKQTLLNLKKLIGQIRKEMSINLDIYFHRDFNSVIYCPSRILNEFGTKENFIKKEGY